MFFSNCRHGVSALLFATVLIGVTPALATAPLADWQALLYKHPKVQAAQQQAEALLWQSKQQQRGLYNPELSTSIEREGHHTNYSIGVQQTFDWSAQHDVRAEQASLLQQLAQAQYLTAVSQHVHSLLSKGLDWQRAQQRYQLLTQQQAFIQQAMQLAEQRFKAGDLGELDLQLTLLNLNQQRQVTAQAFQQLQNAQAELLSQLGQSTLDKWRLPEVFFTLNPSILAGEQRWQQHPQLSVSRLQWQLLRSDSDWQRTQTRVNPTFAIEAGESGDETVLGLSVSVPLLLTNDFSDSVKAATQSANAAEQALLAEQQQWRHRVASQLTSAQFVQRQWQQWQTTAAASQQRSRELIEQAWRANELSTSNYLTAMQQWLESQLAGAELNHAQRQAILDWQYSSGQLSEQLTPPALRGPTSTAKR